MQVSVVVTDLTALLSKHHVVLIILMSPHVYISDQNRKPEGWKSVPGTNDGRSVRAPLNPPPTDGTFSVGLMALSNPGSRSILKQALLNNITPRMYF